ncbi:MAG: hypothetical protein JSS14_22145 [Proteobacteria bacterium]|nr:hypothetical protein [Pseudomonadota bacterium]
MAALTEIQIKEVMRLASILATKRVRRYAAEKFATSDPVEAKRQVMKVEQALRNYLEGIGRE